MSKEIKAIRGQIRQIIKELLPDMINQELQTAMYKQLSGELSAKLLVIEGDIKKQLLEMDNRAKDVQNFIMREMLQNVRTEPTNSDK
jgi:hypothetical protein